ncbi:MAG: cbb3-type cytochrome oxidase assembly protein CcoS [Bacteroidota bacterium]
MPVLIILMACSLLVAAGFLIAFIVSARHGQFDDTAGPAVRMLEDSTFTGKHILNQKNKAHAGN